MQSLAYLLVVVRDSVVSTYAVHMLLYVTVSNL